MNAKAKSALLCTIVLTLLLVFFSGVIGASEKRLVFGSIVPTQVNQFMVYYAEFQKKVAEELGVELIVLDSQDSGERQLGNIEDLIARNVDGIVFLPYWGTGQAGFEKANRAGIPIIATDAVTPGVNPQEQYEQYIAFIGPNDEQAGYDQAKYLIEHMEPNEDGKKYIAALEGTLGTSVSIWRTDGLMRALEEHPEVELVAIQTGNYMRDIGQSVTEDFLAAHPNLGGIWSANDEMALGAINAIKRAGKVPGKDILVTGLNLDPPALEAIENGEMLWSTGGHWLMGGFALVMLYDHIHGYPVPKELSHIQLDLAAVTKDNLHTFYEKYPGGQPTYNAREFSRVFNKDAKTAYFELALE